MKQSNSQQGIAQIIVVMLLLAGIALAVYLVQVRQIFHSQAASDPISSPIFSPLPYPSPSQVPDKDSDGDKWTNRVEQFIGTNPLSNCSKGNKMADWPPDIDNNNNVNNKDYSTVQKAITGGTYSKRYDLTVDGKLNQDDLDTLKKYIGQKCKPPKMNSGGGSDEGGGRSGN